MPIILFVVFAVVTNLLRPGTLADVGVAEDDRHTEVHINQEAYCEAVGWSVSGGAQLEWRNRGTRDMCDPDFRGLITQEVNAGRLRPVAPDGFHQEGDPPVRPMYEVIVHVPNMVYPEAPVTRSVVLIPGTKDDHEGIRSFWRELGIVHTSWPDPMIERVRMSWIIMALPFGQIVLTMLLAMWLGAHGMRGPNRPAKEPSYWNGCWGGFKYAFLEDWKYWTAGFLGVLLMGTSTLFLDPFNPFVIGCIMTLATVLLIITFRKWYRKIRE